MSNETNVSAIGVARGDVARRNYQNGYDAGVREGKSESVGSALTTGFWFGVGTSALIVVICVITYQWGMK